jgi:hypothetical protein
MRRIRVEGPKHLSHSAPASASRSLHNNLMPRPIERALALFLSLALPGQAMAQVRTALPEAPIPAAPAPDISSPEAPWLDTARWIEEAVGVRLDVEAWRKEISIVLRSHPDEPLESALAEAAARSARLDAAASRRLASLLRTGGGALPLLSESIVPTRGLAADGERIYLPAEQSLFYFDGKRAVPDLIGHVDWAGFRDGKPVAASHGRVFEKEASGWVQVFEQPADWPKDPVAVTGYDKIGGTAYLATSQGLYASEGGKGRWISREAVKSMSRRGAQLAAATREGVLLVGPGSGQERELPGTWTYFAKDVDGLRTVGTNRGILVDGRAELESQGHVLDAAMFQGRLHAATDAGVFERSDDGWRLRYPLNFSKHLLVHRGELYASSAQGAFKLNPTGPARWKERLAADLPAPAPADPVSGAADLEQEADGSIVGRGRAIFSALVSRLGGAFPAEAATPESLQLARRFADLLHVPRKTLDVPAFERKAAERLLARPDLPVAQQALEAFGETQLVDPKDVRAASSAAGERLEPVGFRSKVSTVRMIDGLLYQIDIDGLFVMEQGSWKHISDEFVHDVAKIDGRLQIATSRGILAYDGERDGKHEWKVILPVPVGGFQEFEGRWLAYARDIVKPVVYESGRWGKWRRPFFFWPFSRPAGRVHSIVRVGREVYAKIGDDLYHRTWFFWWRRDPFFRGSVKQILELDGRLYVSAKDGLFRINPGSGFIRSRLRKDPVETIAAFDGKLFILPKRGEGIEIQIDDQGKTTELRAGLKAHSLQPAADSLYFSTNSSGWFWRHGRPLLSGDETRAWLQQLAGTYGQSPQAPRKDVEPDAWLGLSRWVEAAFHLQLPPEAWKRETAAELRSWPDAILEGALAAGAAKTIRGFQSENLESWLLQGGMISRAARNTGRPILRAAAHLDKLYFALGSGGLLVFDGTSWKRHSGDFDWVAEIEGTLYASTFGKIVKGLPGAWTSVAPFRIKFPPVLFRGRLYGAGSEGVYRFENGLGEQILEERNVAALSVVDGRLLASTSQGVLELDDLGPRPWGLSGVGVRFLKRYGLRTYAGTAEGLMVEKDGKWEPELTEEKWSTGTPPKLSAEDLVELDGRLFAFTSFGLYEKKEGGWQRVPTPSTRNVDLPKQLIRLGDKLYIISPNHAFEWTEKPAEMPDGWKSDLLGALAQELERQAAAPVSSGADFGQDEAEGTVLRGGRAIFGPNRD